MAENLTDLDVIIVGGGPAGLSSALWSTKLGLTSIILEREAEFGGQLLWTFNAIRDHLGIDAADGRELRDRFLKQTRRADVRGLAGTPIVDIDLIERSATLADGRGARARSIIIATGVSRRALNIPGEQEYKDRGILDSGARARNDVAGKTVVIIGGGDAAAENALILSEYAHKVIVVHRGSGFSARYEFQKGMNERPNIESLMNSRAVAFVGNENVEGVEVESIASGTRSLVAADAVLIRIGVVPNTGMFARQATLDEAGYISIDANCRTSVDGVFAAGDVASPVSLTISNAVGQGSAAARSAARYLKDR